MRRKNKGITLIALVVTIVVLLILAGVSISMLTGENGIISQAQKAKEQNEIGKEKEYIKLAFSSVKSEKISRGDYSDVTSAELQEEINNYTNEATVTGTGILKVTYTSGREYEVDGNGNITSSKSYDGMYSVGELEGKIAPEDLFEYEIIDEQTKIARIVRIKPEYFNLYGYNPHTETYDLTDTNGDIIYKGETISELLVIPYEITINETKYKITEANIAAIYRRFTSGRIEYYMTLPNVTWIIYPNTIEKMEYYSTINEGYCMEYNKNIMVEKITFSNNIKNITGGILNNTLWYENQSDGEIYIGRVYYMYKGAMSENTNITIKEGTTQIAEEAFYDCDNLTSITIPESVTNIGTRAFYDCDNLTSITIPDSVTNIGDEAFYETAWYNNQSDGELYIGKVYYGYKGQMPADTSINIREGTTQIVDGAFSGYSSLTNVTIPDSVTSIGKYTFYNCDSLTRITIPNSITSIGESAFQRCSSLESITIPDSVTNIRDYAFSECNSLTRITIPNNVTSLENYVFYGCSSLTSITIPDSVTSIGYQTFSDCSNLTRIIIPEGVTKIGTYAFSECNNLTSIIIPESVIMIEYGAFEECSSLTSITIPESVTIIEGRTFYDCNNLTNINIKKEENSISGAPWGASNVTVNWNYTGE